MEPWYKVVTPRKEVRDGRSFNPDEFAIALEQVIAGTAPSDYSDPQQFFERTCWTRALREYAGLVLRRLSGETVNTAPVLTLITQFGGGKTHTLTALYHLVNNAQTGNIQNEGVDNLLREAGLSSLPRARVGVFVGNAWDPQDGRETPWIDLAWQLAGEAGVRELGAAAKTSPPGTDALNRVFQAAGGRVLLLFDEVLNFLNRHRGMAESFHAFLQNLTVAVTGVTYGAVVISLPRSQVEMTDWDMQWQDKITKVVRRVAKDLIANDEAEIGEVVRRRLFEDLGNERIRRNVAKAYADWCFERRAQLPPEWTAVDTATTEARAREFLRTRFESCYPFHPATLSVFQRKWQALPQYQQTRGTLAMLAQWVAQAYREGFTLSRREPLITLGSAPLHDLGFRSAILGQLGESRLVAAIDADIAGDHSHARVLDVDTKGPLRNIHRRVGTAILFESSGGQTDKVAHLPELRFALGGPDVDTTSVDNAAFALEAKAYYIQRVGSDGFKIYHKATIRKAVNDRRASLDEETEIKPAMRKLIENEFRRNANISVELFPHDSAAIPDTPRLKLVVMDPEIEWTGNGSLLSQLAEWTKQRGKSPRLYPGSLVWCIKQPGRDLREKVELWLAWKRVAQEVAEGTLGGDFDRADRVDLQSRITAAEQAAKEEVWAGYRFIVLADNREADGIRIIDLGAGHSSSNETLCGRVINALKSEALLNETIGAGYIERHWPPALKDSGAWPLTSLRQSFLNGSLTRLLDPDTTLRGKIVDFVANGDFGLAWGQSSDGTYERVWFQERIRTEDVVFDADVFLLTKAKAQALKASPSAAPAVQGDAAASTAGPDLQPTLPVGELDPELQPKSESVPDTQPSTIRLVGSVPPETWNQLGTKLVPKLRSGSNLKVSVEFSVTVNRNLAGSLIRDLRQVLEELKIADKLRIDVE